MRKQKILIVSLIFIILSLFIAYYIFFMNKDTDLKVASTKDLDVIFYKVGKIEEVYSTDAHATIDDSKKYIYIDVPNLCTKGAYAKIPITIKNIGTKVAALDSITEYGFDKKGPINITYEGIGVTDKPLSPNEETSFFVVIRQEESVQEQVSVRIQIMFNYVQVKEVIL